MGARRLTIAILRIFRLLWPVPIRVSQAMPSAFVAGLLLTFAIFGLYSPPAKASGGYSFSSKFGEGELGGGAWGIASDSSPGAIYVVNSTGPQVLKYNLAGAPENFSALGSNALTEAAGGDFARPAGIAVNPINGDIFVVDLNGNVIDQFNPAGEYLAQITGTGSETFNVPLNAKVDPRNGDLWVIDNGNHVVDEFEETTPGSWKYVRQIKGNEYGLENLQDVAIDSSGNVYVAAFGVGVDKFNQDGENPVAINKGSTAAGVAVDTTTGNVFIKEGGKIIEYDEQGELITTFGTEVKTAGGEFQNIAVNSTTHTVYATDYAGGVVDVFTPFEVKPPVTKTEPATEIKRTTATLNGTVNPENSATEYYFEYSSAPCGINACGTKTTEHGLAGTTLGPAAVHVGNLTAATTYHYWIVAINEESGAEHGEERIFTTESEPPEIKPPKEEPGKEAKTESTFPTFQNFTAIVPVPAPKVAAVPPKVKLTRAQQLTRALNACIKRPKKQRAACKRQARKKYGPIQKKKKRK
jgi:hypothetical protein